MVGRNSQQKIMRNMFADAFLTLRGSAVAVHTLCLQMNIIMHATIAKGCVVNICFAEIIMLQMRNVR